GRLARTLLRGLLAPAGLAALACGGLALGGHGAAGAGARPGASLGGGAAARRALARGAPARRRARPPPSARTSGCLRHIPLLSVQGLRYGYPRSTGHYSTSNAATTGEWSESRMARPSPPATSRAEPASAVGDSRRASPRVSSWSIPSGAVGPTRAWRRSSSANRLGARSGRALRSPPNTSGAPSLQATARSAAASP